MDEEAAPVSYEDLALIENDFEEIDTEISKPQGRLRQCLKTPLTNK